MSRKARSVPHPSGTETKLASDAALFHRWRDHADPRAREELLTRLLPLAKSLAARYRNATEPFDDLLQVATVGLLGAIDRFDPDRGIAFTSFAVPTILGELKRHFRRTSWSAHVPRRAQELSLKIERATRELSALHGHSPTVGEISQYLELSAEDVLSGLDASQARYSTSLDAARPGAQDDAAPEPLGETIGDDDDRLDLVDTTLALGSAMRTLPYRERQALDLRLSSDLKQAEIAQRLGCSQMQVSRLLRRATDRLRELDALPRQPRDRLDSTSGAPATY